MTTTGTDPPSSDLNSLLCALVSNVQTQDKCLELLNGITYNYKTASYYDRILVRFIPSFHQ